MRTKVPEPARPPAKRRRKAFSDCSYRPPTSRRAVARSKRQGSEGVESATPPQHKPEQESSASIKPGVQDAQDSEMTESGLDTLEKAIVIDTELPQDSEMAEGGLDAPEKTIVVDTELPQDSEMAEGGLDTPEENNCYRHGAATRLGNG